MEPARPSAGRVSRVAVTEEAAALLRSLTDAHGPLMFHQSGGCCDGSAPMCFSDGDFILGDADEFLGELDVGLDRSIPVWMTKVQFEYWRHTHLTIDVVKGRGERVLAGPPGRPPVHDPLAVAHRRRAEGARRGLARVC